MPFEIIRNDITLMKADVIVNTANPKVAIGAGVDSAIHKKAGEKLLEARRKIGDMKVTQTAITPAYNLDAKYVIHVVGPIWRGGTEREEELLQECYTNVLELAKKKRCKTIAIPLISSGSYGFPKDKALHIAVKAISSFLIYQEMQVYLVVFGNEAVSLSEKLFNDIKTYIDEKYVEEKIFEEYYQVHETNTYLGSRDFSYEHPRLRESYKGDEGVSAYRIPREDLSTILSEPLHEEPAKEKSLSEPKTKTAAPQKPKATGIKSTPKRKFEDLFDELEESFSESLLRLIDQKGMKDPQVYKKANIDRKLFSKIRNNMQYQPKKATAISLAIALELNLDETKDLLGRAGYTLTHSNKSDVIVEYFIEHKNFDIFELNEVLFTFGLPVLSN